MDQICDRFLYQFVQDTPEYTPFTTDSELYIHLLARMVDVENWDARIEIERADFEKMLSNNHELEMAYVDLYCDSAWFVLMEFEIIEDKYEFYCMVDKREVVLIFFKRADR